MLNENSILKGALFTVRANDRKANGPVMSGNFEQDGKSISVVAFLKVSREGRDFLNLKIGSKDEAVFYGKIFRNNDKKGEKSPDYTGYVELSSDKDAPQLRIAGWKVKSKDSKITYISMEIAPPMNRIDSLVSAEKEDLPL